MAINKIHFFSEGIEFTLSQKIKTRTWLTNLVLSYGKKIKEINFIFCTDDYLLAINQEYLNHDTYTDIITFDQSEKEGILVSDIFISIDRVKENAQNLQLPFHDELHRVMAHGLLHLLGFKDKSKTDQQLMTQKENEALASRTFN